MILYRHQKLIEMTFKHVRILSIFAYSRSRLTLDLLKFGLTLHPTIDPHMTDGGRRIRFVRILHKQLDSCRFDDVQTRIEFKTDQFANIYDQSKILIRS